MQFRKPLPELRDYESDGTLSFEQRRAANIACNNACLSSLGFSVLTPKPKPQPNLPRFTKKVACGLPLFTKRVVPPRKEKKISGIKKDTKQGKWQCPDCPSSFSPRCLPDYVDHIQKIHQIGSSVRSLAPRGLATCLHCDGILDALRGVQVHLHTCKQPRRLLCELIAGPFPRKCIVWWQKSGESGAWWSGKASPSKDNPRNCWRVVYDYDDSEFDELYHQVAFLESDPVSPLAGLITRRRIKDLSAVVSPSWISVGSFSDSSVLDACGFPGVVPDPPSPSFVVSPCDSHNASSPMCETQVAIVSQSLDCKHNSPSATPPGLFPPLSPPTPGMRPTSLPFVPSMNLALRECEISE